MAEKELTAAQIKAAIIKAKTERKKEPIEQAEILGIKGWLFKASSFEMAGWRGYENSKEEDVRKCAAAKLVQICFRDKSGNCCFSDSDVTILAGLDEDIIYPIQRAVLRINGMSPEGLEEIVKNLLMLLGADGLFVLLENMGVRCPKCSKDTASTSCESSGS